MNDLRGTKFRFPLGFEAAGLAFSEEIQAQGSFYLATWPLGSVFLLSFPAVFLWCLMPLVASGMQRSFSLSPPAYP